MLKGCLYPIIGFILAYPIGYMLIKLGCSFELAIVLAFAPCVIGFFVGDAQDRKEKKEILESRGLTENEVAHIGSYVGGHPALDDTIPLCHAYKKGTNLILTKGLGLEEVRGSEIPISCIDNIILQDASTIDKRITTGRMLLVGVFALAWQKKEKNEMAFVEIQWHQGKFDHQTLFCFEGDGAFQHANKARNLLIKACS
jgi:hypothetical protein